MEYLVKKLPSRALSIGVFKSLEKHVCSERFIKQLHAHKMVEQYSWVCFHWWVMREKFAGRIGTQGKAPLLIKNNLQHCLQQYTRDHAYEYEQFFSLDVYRQLKRRSGTLIWSLDDYYRFHFPHKGLQQIIAEDILAITPEQLQQLESHKEKISKMQQYINFNIQYLGQIDLSQIVKNKGIQWKYLSEFQAINTQTENTSNPQSVHETIKTTP